MAGNDKDAKETVAQLQKIYPGFTVPSWTFNVQYQRIVEDLRNAGVSEAEKKTN